METEATPSEDMDTSENCSIASTEPKGSEEQEQESDNKENKDSTENKGLLLLPLFPIKE